MLHSALKAELVANTGTNAYIGGTPDRVFPLVIPQQVPRGTQTTPCVVYEQRERREGVSYCGSDGLVRTVLALDSYSTEYDEAKALAKAVRHALADFRGQLGGIVEVRAATLESEFDVQDFEPGLFRVNQTWVFWHVED